MNQNGGIHKGGFAVLCHRNGGSESPGILTYKGIQCYTGILDNINYMIWYAYFFTSAAILYKVVCILDFYNELIAGDTFITI